MKIAIVGSRGFHDYNLLKEFILNKIKVEDVELMVSGGAKGADTLGEQFAEEFDIEKLIFLPNWQRYGKAAGPLRNTDIVKNSDIVFAFWEPGCRGTTDDINKAKLFEKELHICRFRKPL
tara:strand:+ start:1221 stop:1580 length:360 start_codon:yes stop_codon:yes gene_type:complete